MSDGIGEKGRGHHCSDQVLGYPKHTTTCRALSAPCSQLCFYEIPSFGRKVELKTNILSGVAPSEDRKFSENELITKLKVVGTYKTGLRLGIQLDE